MTARRVPCLHCCRLGAVGEDRYLHATAEHAAALRATQEPAKPAAPSWADVARASAEQAIRVEVEHAAHPLTPPKAPPHDATGAIDWQRVRREAAAYGPGPFGLLMWQESRLTANGFPGMSPWWLETLENFYASHKRWLLVLAGRGGGKSTVLTRVAACSVDIERRIPPGQTWIYPFVSVRLADARRRLFEIKEILERAYGIHSTNAKGEACELKITSPEGTPTLPLLDSHGQSIAFVSFASTIGNVSGPNAIGATVDEEEKLMQEEDGGPARANPASEIIGSLVQTFRARAGIRGIRCSSAMKATGSLYTSIAEGDTLTNYVAKLGARFLPEAVAGCEEVARWEDARGDGAAAALLREHARSLSADSCMIPSWVANGMYGPTPETRAVALRVEVDALPPAKLDGLTRAAYFLRENCSRPVGMAADGDDGDDAPYKVCGEPSRYAGETAEDRGYDAR